MIDNFVGSGLSMNFIILDFQVVLLKFDQALLIA